MADKQASSGEGMELAPLDKAKVGYFLLSKVLMVLAENGEFLMLFCIFKRCYLNKIMRQVSISKS